jgi:flagellin
MSVINTNVSSLTAQRNLNTSASSLSTSMQRLSSGLRINSAKDDAAGLAIASRMTTQVKGMDQAVRNANDGISLAQTTEGALGEISNNLQRIRELAVQSSNATNSDTDRDALQKEVKQLQSEIQRVATQTSFNGTKVLDGTFTNKSFQVGAEAGQVISVSGVSSMKTADLGSTKFAADQTGATVTGAASASLNINGVDIAAVAANTDLDKSGAAFVAAINDKSGETGVVASIGTDSTDAATYRQITLTSVVADQDLTITGTGGGLSSTVTATASAATAVTVSDVDISTFEGAQHAIGTIDSALTEVNSARADLGAIQNRFTSTVTNLQTGSENLSASRSRIQDADFAAETANLSRAQVLQQAGTAMVAQANQLPSGVLALLR